MEAINKNTLLELADHRSEHCISIYIPTHVKGGEVNEGYDPILFKNQVQKVRGSLQEKGLRSNEVEELLAPLEELRNDWVFWRYQREGLAVLRSKDVFEYYRSPIPFEESCQIGPQFQIRPLFHFAQPLKPYYVLRLAKDNATLFKADRFSIEEMQTALPSGLEEVTQYYDFEEELQGRTKSGGGGPMAMHRSDDMDNKQKDHLLADYFRLVDEAVKNAVDTNNSPLVLACVEYYQPIYRQVNSYPFLHTSGVTGNFEQMHPYHLHDQVNEHMQAFFTNMQDKRITQYQNSSGGERTSHDLRHILESAVTGRVDTLFVRHDAQVWGHFDEQNLTATIHDEPKEGDQSLVDQAMVLTLRNGGEVYLLDSVDLLPQPDDDHAGVAALYRF